MQKIFVLIPGIGQNETVVDFCDVLCDYSQHFGDPEFHALAIECDTWVKEHGSTVVSELNDAQVGALLDMKNALVCRLAETVPLMDIAERAKKLDPEKHEHFKVFERVEASSSVLDTEFESILVDFPGVDNQFMRLLWNRAISVGRVLGIGISKTAQDTMDEWMMYRTISTARQIS